MQLKTVEIEGKTYAEVQDGKPVYSDAGKEIAFDAPGTVATISRLNGEAKGHREAKEAAEAKLRAFDGLTDPEAARKALETVANLDSKKLIDAGEVDRVKAEIGKSWEAKLAAEQARAATLEQSLHDEKIGGAFARSKTIADKFAIPADLVQARFGSNFKLEDGKVVAYDQHGNKLYSKANPGNAADFEEALELIVDGYPYKDTILKGQVAAGGGAGHGGGGSGGAKTMARADFDKLDAKTRAAKMAETGFTITE